MPAAAADIGRQTGLLYRSGRFRRVVAPGAYLLLTPWSEIALIDVRRRMVTVPGQAK